VLPSASTIYIFVLISETVPSEVEVKLLFSGSLTVGFVDSEVVSCTKSKYFGVTDITVFYKV